MNYRNQIAHMAILASLAVMTGCGSKQGAASSPTVPADSLQAFYLTRGDQASLLQLQPGSLVFGTVQNGYASIEVDSTQTFQTIDGFGYTLTGGSAYLLRQMDGASRSNLLQEIFSDSNQGIGVSYLRVSIGASDLNASVYSYDDMPAGQTDTALSKFSLAEDTVDLIPVLKEIKAIRPGISILGSPWSAPAWMKDNGSSIGGHLQHQYYAVYARYLLRYLQAMESQGITLDAITIQNEPLNAGNNPSMLMSAQEQADFVGNYLGPLFRQAGVGTKIIIYDHNCDRPDYPLAVLNDANARPYIDGSAFHLYAGDISALGSVHSAFPDKNLYFTEQWTGASGSFDGDFVWHIKNVIIGSMRNWSKTALEWNLASAPDYHPHTPGGCSECKGALTLSGSSVSRNVGYYIIAQVSKFVPPGSVRLSSNNSGSLYSVAFQRPDGKKVCVVLNEGSSAEGFNLRFRQQWITATLPAKSAGTFIW